MDAKNPSYYTNHAVETCVKQDMIADILESAGVPARRIKDATTAVKYTDRAAQWEIRDMANAIVAEMEKLDDLAPMVGVWRETRYK